MCTFHGENIIVRYIRSNELYDIFHVSKAGFAGYVSFPRSSGHTCESVAAFY